MAGRAGSLRNPAGPLSRPEVTQQQSGLLLLGCGEWASLCALVCFGFKLKKKMISHIIRAVAARLCSRCFYWKYQEEGQGRVVFLFQPGPEEEEEERAAGRMGQQAVFTVGKQLSRRQAQL